MPGGSLQEWLFTFSVRSTGAPYPIDPTAWEYVVRETATTPGSPLISVTPAPGAQGQLVVTSTATVSSVQVSLTPAATAALAPQEYSHSLWMQPGTGSAYTWLTGSLIVVGNPQP
jgi:hypothetical protein